MSALDVVLQTPPQPRAINGGTKSDRNIDHEHADKKGGFDVALAKSGTRDDTSATLKSSDGDAEPDIGEAPGEGKQNPHEMSEKTKTKRPVIQLSNWSAAAVAKDEKIQSAETTGQDVKVSKAGNRKGQLETALGSLLNDKAMTRIQNGEGASQAENITNLQAQLEDLVTQYLALQDAARTGENLTAKKTDGATQEPTAKAPKLPKSELMEKLEKALKNALKAKDDTLSVDEPAAGPTSGQPVEDGMHGLFDLLGTMNAQITAATTQGQLPQAELSTDVLAEAFAVVMPANADHLTKAESRDGKDNHAAAKADGKSGASLPQGDSDTLFRFSRADGTGKSLDLQIAGGKMPATDRDAPSAPQPKVENVTVLDARRYLALAPDSNAFNIVAQIAGDKELSTALTSSIIDPDKTAATSKVVNTLKLQMNPLDLGTVTATLRLRGDELSVAITVQNSHAYQQLNGDQDKMVEALRAQGFAVDQVTIQLVSADRSAFQDQPQQQPSGQGQQQQARNDAAAQQQGRQQGNGSSQDNAPQRGRQGYDAPAESSSAAVTGDLRSGQVYV